MYLARLLKVSLFCLPILAHVSPASASEVIKCSFKASGMKIFTHALSTNEYRDEKGNLFEILARDEFLQLRSTQIDIDNVNNPFTVYLINRNTLKIRQISGAMRAAPMMSDGSCEFHN